MRHRNTIRCASFSLAHSTAFLYTGKAEDILPRRNPLIILIGTKCRLEQTVTDALTAANVGSGALPVFGTPYMSALMENAAMTCLQSFLEEGQGSVGTHLDISHDAPTPIGMKVWAEAEITAVSENGKMVDFAVKAWDESGPIGSGTHTRAIVKNEKFLAKCNAKLEKK